MSFSANIVGRIVAGPQVEKVGNSQIRRVRAVIEIEKGDHAGASVDVIARKEADDALSARRAGDLVWLYGFPRITMGVDAYGEPTPLVTLMASQVELSRPKSPRHDVERVWRAAA